jgi:HD-GYP domain-containing protein (c-di-GMP phosphodiesterase class II)
MSAPATYPASATIRDRCRALGMPSWRADTAGTIVEDPSEPGLAGLWLRSGRVSELVSTAARAWSRQPSKASVVEMFPGCWLIPIADEERRRRLGMTIAMALSPAALTSEMFAEACRAAGLDEHTARMTMRANAAFDRPAAETAAKMLQWMGRDLGSLAEHEGAVAGFTNELGQSYDTIDLLYSLGRSMMDLGHPERFVEQACERLQGTMQFAWLAARFSDDGKVAGAMAGRFVLRGTASRPRAELDAAAAQVLGTMSPDSGPRILPQDAEPWSALGTQVLAQPILREGQVAGVILCGDKSGLDPQVSSYDMRLVEATAAYTGSFLDNACLFQNQEAMLLGSLKALTSAIDAKDRYTCGHSERVALLARQLSLAAGLEEAAAERVHMCGLLHDVGKIGVPEAVLCKAGRLTDQEFAQIKLHPEIGHRILRDIPMLEDLLPGVLHHHERWDGRGYPHGLAGDRIPPFARLLALADTFDAMSSNRAYRAAMPRPMVMTEIARHAGSQFDPELARVFATLDLTAYDEMVARHLHEHEGRFAAAA